MDGIAQKFLLRRDNISIEKKLGEGQFGQVMLATLQIRFFMKRKVALKTMKHGAVSDDERREFWKEAKVMALFNHKNVVAFHGIVEKDQMIIMEFCKQGSLEEELRKDTKVEEHQKIRWLYEAISGIDHIHQRHVIHGWISTEILRHDRTSNRTLKIADFGLAKQGIVRRLRTAGKLPVNTLAPESLKDGRFSFLSDIYSYGALIYEVVTDGLVPFENVHHQGNELRRAILDKTVVLELPSSCPNSITRIFACCRSYDYDERCTSQEVIEMFRKETNVDQGRFFFSKWLPSSHQ